jgi:hypothetical protein
MSPHGWRTALGCTAARHIAAGKHPETRGLTASDLPRLLRQAMPPCAAQDSHVVKQQQHHTCSSKPRHQNMYASATAGALPMPASYGSSVENMRLPDSRLGQCHSLQIIYGLPAVQWMYTFPSPCAYARATARTASGRFCRRLKGSKSRISWRTWRTSPRSAARATIGATSRSKYAMSESVCRETGIKEHVTHHSCKRIHQPALLGDVPNPVLSPPCCKQRTVPTPSSSTSLHTPLKVCSCWRHFPMTAV